jgi:hypothetical protein
MSGRRNRSISSATAAARSAARHPRPGRDAAHGDAPHDGTDEFFRGNESGISAAAPLRAVQHPMNGRVGRRPRTLNKTSIKPAVYAERFVKRRGLFSVAWRRFTVPL